MPELPEVEFCRRQLTRWSAGRRVVGVRVPTPSAIRHKLSTRGTDALDGGRERVKEVVEGEVCGPISRHGKRLGWRFGQGGLLLHLGMTGKWVRRQSHEEVPRFGRVGLVLDDGAALWFCDARTFGGVVPFGHSAELSEALSAGLGPDALDEAPNGETLKALLDGRGKIKARLMDQSKLAGVGNIQALEALFRGGVLPSRVAQTLTDEEWRGVAAGLQETLAMTLEDAESGEELVYLTEGGSNPFLVYGRAGQDCLTCGSPLHSDRVGGRISVYCPSCQR